jgi:hypothetical protein
MLYKQMAHLSARLFLAGTLWIGLSSVVSAAPNLMDDANGMDDTPLVDNPWGGVVDGTITMPPGVQLGVNDDGNVVPTVFSPSVAVGDLNGDGLPDLVIADASGYFWYFPNSGSSTQPKFTTGEIMPIWIGDPVLPADDRSLFSQNYDAMQNTVPRIQLLDYTGEKRLSIVAGNYAGKLFYIHNIGSNTEPNFSMPTDLSAITANTYSEGRLWCNFLSPFLYDFTGNGHLDLMVGEGTYASNSIYRLINKGNNGSPVFSENFTTKIIKGYGREHLNPQVVDWNNDGKPDIITGERAGFVDVFLNDSPDNVPDHMHFVDPPPPAPPNNVNFGGSDQVGLLTTVTVADLTNNKLPNLVISNSDTKVMYAKNKGKLGTPAFDAPVPIQAVNPYPKVFSPPQNWRILKSFSMPYVLLVSTKAQDDPTFKAPDDAPTIKSALKIYTVEHTHKYFHNEVYPAEDTHIINYTEDTQLDAGTHYDFSFWAKTDGNISNPRFFFAGRENLEKQGVHIPGGTWYRDNFVEDNMDSGSSWVQEKADIYIEKAVEGKNDTAPVQFYIAFNGNGGSLTVAGFTLTKRER